MSEAKLRIPATPACLACLTVHRVPAGVSKSKCRLAVILPPICEVCMEQMRWEPLMGRKQHDIVRRWGRDILQQPRCAGKILDIGLTKALREVGPLQTSRTRRR